LDTGRKRRADAHSRPNRDFRRLLDGNRLQDCCRGRWGDRRDRTAAWRQKGWRSSSGFWIIRGATTITRSGDV